MEELLARVAARVGDRWALRLLEVLLRRQQRRIRETLAVVDEPSHRLLSRRLVPTGRLARMGLRGGQRAAVPALTRGETEGPSPLSYAAVTFLAFHGAG